MHQIEQGEDGSQRAIVQIHPEEQREDGQIPEDEDPCALLTGDAAHRRVPDALKFRGRADQAGTAWTPRSSRSMRRIATRVYRLTRIAQVKNAASAT